MAVLSLDVLIPSYNRAPFLRTLLQSLGAAPVPSSLAVTVTVIDNDSADETVAVVDELAPPGGGRLRYLREPRAGKSAALNTGIAATTGDLIALLDDDEVIAPHWFACIAATFQDGTVDFISGRCLPQWQALAPPSWLPAAYPAVIGALDGGTCVRQFRKDYDGCLSGGNSVIRRTILERVGAFSQRLGPRADHRLLCCEDEDIYLRLIDVGARGRYVPDLLVYHHVHPTRLTRRYHRNWCFWRGVSKALLHEGRRQDLPHVGSIPRFLYGAAARGLLRMLRSSITEAARFDAELAVWDLVGFVYGRYFFRSANCVEPAMPEPILTKSPAPGCGASVLG